MQCLGIKQVLRLLESNARLCWNREGEVRRVPRHVLENAIDQYVDDIALGGWRMNANVYWDQTVNLDAAGS